MKLLHKLVPIFLATTAVGALGGVGAIWGAPGHGDAAMDALQAQANTVVAAIQEDLHAVQHEQALARKDKDVIKLNCVNDKLVQMKPEMNIADKALASVQGANDLTDERVALAGVTQAADRIHKLRGGAEECAGNKVLSTESANAFTHPDVDLNPTDNPYEQTIEPPIYASPYN